jgi:ABC-type antimicrobial peptide transport system permease subunit
MARLVLGTAARLALWGIAIGCAGSYLLRGALSGLLFAVSPSDPWTVLAVVGIVCAAAIAGSLGPMRRTLRVDPASALRSE